MLKALSGCVISSIIMSEICKHNETQRVAEIFSRNTKVTVIRPFFPLRCVYFTIYVCFKRPLDNNVSTTEVLLQPEPQYIKRLLFARTRQSFLIKHRLFSTEELVRKKLPQRKRKKDMQSFILLRWLQLPASHAGIFISCLMCLHTGVA